MYSSDIIKSNKRQISKSNISKTAAILKNAKNESFLDFYLVYKHVLLADYAMKTVKVTIGSYFCLNLCEKEFFSLLVKFWDLVKIKTPI